MPAGYGNEVFKVKKGKKVTAELIFLILMTVLMTALTGCNKTDKITDTTKNPAIKIGSDNYPPYNFLNEDGMPTGIDVDLATEAFGRMGYKIDHSHQLGTEKETVRKWRNRLYYGLFFHERTTG